MTAQYTTGHNGRRENLSLLTDPVLAPPRPTPATAEAAIERPGEILSPSQLNCYLECPAKWYYRSLVRLPEVPGASLVLGSAVDEALSYNFKHKATSGEDLAAGDVEEAFSCAWAEQMETAELADSDNPAELHEAGRQMVARYLVELAPQVQPALVTRDGQQLPAVQLHLEGVIGGVKVQGYVDVLTVVGVVIDLKTAKKKPSGVPPDYKIQLATYHRLAPEATGRGTLHYMIHTSKTISTLPLSHEVTPADVAHIETLYPMVQEAMRDGLYLPRRTSNLCSRKYCSFWRRCQADYGGEVD